MPRYRTYGGNDDVPLLDGDTIFTGFASRIQPTALGEGIASYAGNMRADRGTYKVRAGSVALSTDITITNPTLLVGGFSLAADVTVSSITRAASTATVTTSGAHGYSSSDLVNIRGAGQTEYNIDATVTVTGANTFTYSVSGTPATPATGTIYANKGPVLRNTYSDQIRAACVYASDENVEGILMVSGDTAYAYREGESTAAIAYPANELVDITDTVDVLNVLGQVYLVRGYRVASDFTASSLTQTAGTATFTSATNHGLSTNDWVYIKGASPVNYNGAFQVTVTGATTFTYTVAGAPASPATGTIIGRECKVPLKWDRNVANDFVRVTTGASTGTLVRLPPVDWIEEFNSRTVVPFERDQLLLSDIQDAETFDNVYAQFRIKPGTNDWIVGAAPYQDDKLLVFYRKSIHALMFDANNLTLSQALIVAPDVGCVARQTIATCGDFILWLSDNGVYQLSMGELLSLRGSQLPLSDRIQDQIGLINWTYAGNAVATYYNNRYYLAIPTGTSTKNNAILVYNFINREWESVDTYPGSFSVVDLLIMDYAGRKTIHAVTDYGFIFALEQGQTDQWGRSSSITSYPIAGTLYTRNYLAKTFDLKRFKRFQLESNLTAADGFTVNFRSENPDASRSVLTYISPTDNEVTHRGSVGLRGVSGRLEITTTAGRPEFKSAVIESSESDRKPISFS